LLNIAKWSLLNTKLRPIDIRWAAWSMSLGRRRIDIPKKEKSGSHVMADVVHEVDRHHVAMVFWTTSTSVDQLVISGMKI
jgi:hypothetical protein